MHILRRMHRQHTCIQLPVLSTSVAVLSLTPLPTADFSQTVAPCDSVVSFANLSANANSMLWDFGDGILSDEFSPQHTYSLSGQIPVSLVVSSPYGCQDTTKKNIFLKKDYI